MLSPCQQNVDSTVQNFYNVFEVINVVMKPGTKTITLRVSEELYSQIAYMAKNEERSINNFVTYAVKEYIEHKTKCVKK